MFFLNYSINAGKLVSDKEFLLRKPIVYLSSVLPPLAVVSKTDQYNIRDFLIIRKTPSPPVDVSIAKNASTNNNSKYLTKNKLGIIKLPNCNLLVKQNENKRVKKNDDVPRVQRRKFAVLPPVNT